MEDMLSETEKIAGEIGLLLSEHNGSDVLVLDVREMIDWTDYFIIATTSSYTHMDGLERHIKEFCRQRKMDIVRKSQRSRAGDDEWRLIDLGRAVIHLMSRNAREFYELERLWTNLGTGSHSSKSS